MVVPAFTGALGTIRIDIDPVIRIGSLSIHWYGVMYAVAFLVAFRYGVLPHVEKRGISRGTAERALVWTIIFGLLGARLYYVVQQPNLGDYLHNPVRIIAVWEGGMAFFGAIIAGLACVAVFAWRNRISTWLHVGRRGHLRGGRSAHRAHRQHHQRRHPRRAEQPALGDRLRQPPRRPAERLPPRQRPRRSVVLPAGRGVRGARHHRHRR